MVRDIDGFWLLPDNRVLSSRVLQQMLAEAKQQHVPVSVPSESMLSLGAMISLTTQASDIAATIAKVVRMIQGGDINNGIWDPNDQAGDSFDPRTSTGKSFDLSTWFGSPTPWTPA